MLIGSGPETYRFDFDKPLRARGKNGVVWLGTHVLNGEKVIIKWHKTPVAETGLPPLPGIQQKKGRLSHEGRTFHIYEYIEGSDLQTLSAQPAATWKDPSFVLEKWKQCLQVLGSLHQAGFLHTDIKLSNWIYQPATDLMYLIDLDNARPYPLQQNTQRAYIFSSPEQYLGIKELMGPWSDLFSLGICFYILFARKMPYESGHAAVLEQMQLALPLPPDKNIPPAVWEVLQKACKKPAFTRPPAQLSQDECRLRIIENIAERYTDSAGLLQRLNEIDILKPKHSFRLWKK